MSIKEHTIGILDLLLGLIHEISMSSVIYLIADQASGQKGKRWQMIANELREAGRRISKIEDDHCCEEPLCRY